MARIGFVGLGTMGKPMAKLLKNAGHELFVKNRSRASEDELVSDGAIRCDNVGEVARNSEIVITMLPGPREIKELVLGENGILGNLAAGSVFVDMSTSTPSLAQMIAREGAKSSIGVLDAPVSGGEAGAKTGGLAIMVGGDREVFERILPIFEVMGKTISLVGPHGAGQTVKAANQLLVAGNLALVAEAIVFLENMDVDYEAALEVIKDGLAGSTVLSRKGEQMLRRDFAPSFRVDLHHKDLGIVLDVSREKDLTLVVTSLVAQLFTSLRSAGEGDLDHSAVIRVVERLNGG